MSVVRKIFLALCLIWGIATPSDSWSVPRKAEANRSERSKRLAQPQTYDQILKEIAQLRKSDPKGRRVEAWRRAGESLERIRTATALGAEEPRALFLLGYVYQVLFERVGAPGDATKAIGYYDLIAEKHYGHDLADDALLSVGDLRRAAQSDEARAKQAYLEVLDLYPKSRSAQLARQRLTKSSARAQLTQTGAAPQAAKSPVTRSTPPPIVPTEKLVGAAPRIESDGRSVFSQPVSVSRPLIVIDPGHGGDDVGAVGGSGLKEKQVVLDISHMLADLLKERLRARVVLTRSDDRFIPLQGRIAIANKEKADLFVSIHANASELKSASGVETYYLDNTEDKSSLRLAERENSSERFSRGGKAFDISYIVSDLIQSGKQEDSISLAHRLQENLAGTLKRYFEGVNDLGVKRAPFYVLVGSHMPSVLVEVSFIDHPVEGKRLGDRRYQQLIALGLYQGIRAFFAKEENGVRASK